MAEQIVPVKDLTDITQLMKRWEEESANSGYDPIPILSRMAEIVEADFDTFIKMDPDPFDERHPSRVDPSGPLGQVLRVIFKKEHFMDKLVNDYLRDNYWSRAGFPERDATELNIAASRLVIDVLPGLEASAVFQTPDAESLVMRLFSWAEKTQDPLKTYAVGLLAAAMEIQDTAAAFKEQNTKFLPVMLSRLRALQEEMALQRQEKAKQEKAHRPFAHLNHETTPLKKKAGNRRSSSNCGSPRRRLGSPPLMSPPAFEMDVDKSSKINGHTHKRNKEIDDSHNDDIVTTPNSTVAVSDCSNSSWAEMEGLVIASLPIHPLTLASKQMLILRYLTPMGEYQEFLSYIFEYKALSIILNYTNIRETRETRLGFEALKYLAALLCHKKVSIEFINMGGLRRLLEVPRPSVAATGVSICFYYLAYCEDAMERICASPSYVISELVSYALWLLECSHNSGRCHATMFFGLSFQFRVILEEFDAQDGLRKLYNAISTLPILAPEDERTNVNEDEECSLRQMVRHVAVALKRYYEAHLAIKVEHYTRLAGRSSRAEALPYKPRRSTPEEVQEQIETLLELMPFNAPWPCVDDFQKLGGIALLLQTIAQTFEWNFSGRAETVQSILNVLAICCVKPSVQMTFCERLELPDQTVSVGMNIILGSCEGEVVPDPEVQKAALQVIINCVCAPVDRVGSPPYNKDSKDPPGGKKRVRSSEELIQKVWGSVRENNGIIVLLMLMMVKTPITDADALRALACRALSGLARCQKVCQIVSKLPALSNGSMQAAVKDPILHEKRQEHVQFQKYYLKLLEHIAGKNQRGTCEDVSLTNIHRANVVAQTKITYNKYQLYQLIHQQLLLDGLQDAANVLFKEAGLSVPKAPSTPATFGNSSRTILPRSTPKSSQSPRVLFPNNQSTPSGPTPSTPTSPIKLNLSKKDKLNVLNATTPNRSLQKQTRWDSSEAAVLLKNPPIPQQPPYPSDRVTLHSIVTEYLTNQHALCKNPMVTCPQFNLFVPHKCPEPKYRVEAPINHTMRFLRRQTGFAVGNSMDIRLTHSRFFPERTIRVNPDDGFILSCEFLPNSNFLAVGNYHGEVRLYNVHTGAEEVVYQCHDSLVFNIESNRSGDLLLTSTSWRRPLSALWSINSQFDSKLFFEEEEFVEFSKLTQDKVVGTKETSASIYDIETGRVTLKMVPVLPNTYSKNRATFNPTDELILTDGVLFDVRSGQEIHKFDKLNSAISGVFHPNGLEIVSNSEIWDLRTFHLMRTVSSLDGQFVMFNNPGSVIYTYSCEQDNDGESIYESSFKTLESRNYSSIATIDTKKEIYNMACNTHDTQIAIVENQGEGHLTVQESSVRIYEVGRRRDAEDDVEEEEDEEMSEDGSGSNSEDDGDSRSIQNIVDALIPGLRDQAEGEEEDDPDFEFSSNEDESDVSGDSSDSSSSDTEEEFRI